jgi:hypothetical protein
MHEWLHASQGASEQFQFTVQRIGTDMDRLTTEPAFLSLEPTSRRAHCLAMGKRVLAAYALTDPEVGYCQGMSDLLAPLLEIWGADQGGQTADPEEGRSSGSDELQVSWVHHRGLPYT